MLFNWINFNYNIIIYELIVFGYVKDYVKLYENLKKVILCCAGGFSKKKIIYLKNKWIYEYVVLLYLIFYYNYIVL